MSLQRDYYSSKMEVPFYVEQKVNCYNGSNIILFRLTSYRHAAQHGRKQSYEHYSEAQNYYYLESQKVLQHKKT
jgi:hypothetical protein